MSMIKEFKEFAMKGNLIDMAIAVVMAGAFGKVTSAFIDGMVMPAVGMLTGGTDFNDKVISLKEAVTEVKDATGAIITKAEPAVVIKYGTFITVTIEFLIVAMVMFMVIKAINKMKKAEAAAPAAPPAPSSTDVLLMEIRDSLKK
jgi:large conductance mechanosensitive channel